MTFTKNKLAESLIHSQNKEREDASSKKYWFMQNNLRLISLPKDLFTNVKQVEFENRNFFVYNKKLVIDSYGAACISNQINVISDANMPYDEYLKYIEGKENTLASLSRSRAEFNFWLKTVWKPAEKRRSDIFSQIKRSVDRINIWHSLRLKREEIRAAYKEKDIDRLRNLLKTYLSTTDKYAKKDIGFYIDDELFECAKLIWEKDHRKKFAEKVYSMVPDLYRNETPDEYFSKR